MSKLVSANHAKAIALTKLGIHVFPVIPKNSSHGKYKAPYVKNGFRSATTSIEVIDYWWTIWPDALVGYWTGESSLITLDLDNKPYGSGESEVEALDLPYVSPIRYKTPSGGWHHVYRAPSHKQLNPKSPIKGFYFVDLRAGNSYAIWYGEVPETLDSLPETPDWIVSSQSPSSSGFRAKQSSTRTSSGLYEGNLGVWLEWLENGEMWFAAKGIEIEVDRLEHIGHDDLRRLLTRIHMTRQEGGTGLAPVLAKLILKFKSTTGNTDGWGRELDDIVRWVIGKEWSPTPIVETKSEGGIR